MTLPNFVSSKESKKNSEKTICWENVLKKENPRTEKVSKETLPN